MVVTAFASSSAWLHWSKHHIYNFVCGAITEIKWASRKTHCTYLTLSMLIYCLCLLSFTVLYWLMSLPCWLACLSRVMLHLEWGIWIWLCHQTEKQTATLFQSSFFIFPVVTLHLENKLVRVMVWGCVLSFDFLHSEKVCVPQLFSTASLVFCFDLAWWLKAFL